MAFITPEDIVAKAERAYPDYLMAWIRGTGEDYFPKLLKLSRFVPDLHNFKATVDASEKLWSNSKAVRGWGYTVHREQVRSRDFGTNEFPKRITIDTQDDLLRLTGKREHFAATELVAERVRAELAQLEDWLVRSVGRLAELAPVVEGLIAVTRFFMEHPRPDCYARQIPVAVDTKFVERHRATLRQWLDLLLPAWAIDVNETGFAHRFGLRDGQPHRALRLLDPAMVDELGLRFDELSLPLRSIATLPVHDATVTILENDVNLFTLPACHRGIALRGEGKAATRLEPVEWLGTNRVLYWGDLDVDGFLILASLRKLFPHVESVMMDRDTLDHHRDLVGSGNGSTPMLPANLTPEEAAAFNQCVENNWRLEQEKIPQPFVDETFARCAKSS